MKSIKKKVRLELIVLIFFGIFTTLNTIEMEDFLDKFGVEISDLNPFEIPHVETFELRNGMKIILLQDNSLPRIEINGITRAGSYLDPEGKLGLMSSMYSLMVSGGTKNYSPDELEKILSNNAIELIFSCRVQLGYIQMGFLSEDLELAFSLLRDALANPIFPQDRLETQKMIMKNNILRTNTRQVDLAQNQLWKAVVGDDNPYGRNPDFHDIDNITREDLLKAHKKYVRPDSIVLSIFGDFDSELMKNKLGEIFGDWNVPGDPVEIPFFSFKQQEPAVHLVPFKDATQAWVYLAHQGNLQPTDDDYYAMVIINHILGNSFSGRIVSRIRVEMGLAYSPGAQYISNFGFPGFFYMFTQTRNDEVINVIDAMIDEANKIRDIKIPEKELFHAKQSYLNSFVFKYDSNRDLMRTLAEYKMFDVPFDHLENIVSNIRDLTQQDIQRVAKEYIRPDLFSIVVTGNYEDYLDGMEKFGNVNMVEPSLTEPPRQPTRADIEKKYSNEVRRIIKRYASALGDIDRVENVYFEGVSTEYRHNRKSEVTISAYIAYPDRIKQLIDTPNGPVEMIYNNGKGIMYFPGSRMQLPPEFLVELENNLKTSPIGLIKHFIDEYEVRLLDRLIIKNIDSYMLAFKKGDDEFILVIDSRNYLPHQSIHQTYGIDGPEILYKDIVEYKRFDGILYPVKIVTRNSYGEIVSEVIFNSIEFNVEIDDQMFEF